MISLVQFHEMKRPLDVPEGISGEGLPVGSIILRVGRGARAGADTARVHDSGFAGFRVDEGPLRTCNVASILGAKFLHEGVRGLAVPRDSTVIPPDCQSTPKVVPRAIVVNLLMSIRNICF